MIPVWDPVVRVLHWTLALGVGLAWLTTEWFGAWHEAVGYVALGAVALRTAWGFLGGRHARFAQFVRGPIATGRYARLVLQRREPRHIGHNPLGAWMVVALMLCVAALGVTGWLYKTDRFWGDATVEALHVGLAWTVVMLIVVHVIGVVVASLRHRENLVVAMVDGRKRAARADDVA